MELSKHEEVFKYSSIYEDYLRKNTDRKFWLVNTNKLVRFYNGADGLKTGYTSLAGYCLTATAKRDGMRLIAVVMGEESSETRNQEVSQMLDYGFANYGIVNVLTTNDKVGNTNVIKSKKETIDLYPIDNVTLLYKKIDSKPNITYELDVKTLEAPLKKGNIVGKLKINKNDNYFKSIDLVINEDIEKINFIEQYLLNLKRIFE